MIIFSFNFTVFVVVIIIANIVIIIMPFAIIMHMLTFTAVIGDLITINTAITAIVSFNYYFSINLYK